MASCRYGSDITGLMPGADEIVINELSVGRSSEWFEIANRGSSPFELGGYAVADTDKVTGAPKARDAARFPPGTRIEPGGHILVISGKKDLRVGPYDMSMCLPNVPMPCFYAPFGVSSTAAEPLHFLSPQDVLIATTPYPTVIVDPATGKTACRFPDLTGELALCAPTPGAANAL